MSAARIGWPHSEQRSSTWLIWPQADVPPLLFARASRAAAARVA